MKWDRSEKRRDRERERERERERKERARATPDILQTAPTQRACMPACIHTRIFKMHQSISPRFSAGIFLSVARQTRCIRLFIPPGGISTRLSPIFAHGSVEQHFRNWLRKEIAWKYDGTLTKVSTTRNQPRLQRQMYPVSPETYERYFGLKTL